MESPHTSSSLLVHPEVLHLAESEQSIWLLMAGLEMSTAHQLHIALREAIETLFLSVLSFPLQKEPTHVPDALVLSLYDQPSDYMKALEAFAFSEHSYDSLMREYPKVWPRALRHMRHALSEIPNIADEPLCSCTTTLYVPKHLRTLNAELGLICESQPWGTQPGKMGDMLCEQLGLTQTKGLSLLRQLERSLLSDAPHEVVKWIPSNVFQAVCDLIGLVLARDYQLEIAWAQSQPDEDGVCTPPLFLVKDKGREMHLPIGEMLLRFWVMPSREDETISSISDVLEHEFGLSD